MSTPRSRAAHFEPPRQRRLITGFLIMTAAATCMACECSDTCPPVSTCCDNVEGDAAAQCAPADCYQNTTAVVTNWFNENGWENVNAPDGSQLSAILIDAYRIIDFALDDIVLLYTLQVFDGSTMSVQDDGMLEVGDGGILFVGSELLVDGAPAINSATDFELRNGGVYRALTAVDVANAPTPQGVSRGPGGASLGTPEANLSVEREVRIVERMPEVEPDEPPPPSSMVLSGSMSLAVQGSIFLNNLDSCTPPILSVEDDAVITARDDLNIGRDVSLAYASTMAMTLGGDFNNQANQNDNGQFDWNDGGLILDGDTDIEHKFEVASADVGPNPNAFDERFAMGSIEIGAGRTVRFADGLHNGNRGGTTAESLYVQELIIGDDAVVILDGITLYYGSLIPGSNVSIDLNNLQCVTPAGVLCTPCLALADCDDGVFCNGSESCADGICAAGTPPCPDNCDEELGACP